MLVVDLDAGDRPVEPPRIAAEPLGALPDEQERHEDERDADDAASRRPAIDSAPTAGADRPDARSEPLAVVIGGRRPIGHRRQATAWSAMSSARSMISKPSASWSSVMHSGGLVWIELLGEHRVQPRLAQELADRLHLVRGPVERRERGPRVAAPDEVDDPEQAQVAGRPDARMLGRQPAVVLAHDRVEAGRVVDQAVLLVDTDRGQRRREADRVAAVGQPAVEHLGLELLGQAVAHGDRAERQVRAGQALGHRHQVRGHAPVVDGEPATRSPEAGHDLVGDHQDVVAIADLAHAGDVAVGRDEDAVGPDDGLEEDRRDRLRALVADDVLEALQALGHGSRFRLAPAVRVRVADHADEAGLVRPAARVAGQGHGAHRGAVVRAVAGEDLVAAGRVAGQLDGVLDRLRAAEGEEHLVHVAGQDLGQLRPEPGADLGRERGLDELELGRLGGDGVDDAPVAVADVDRHQLAVEVDDPLPLGRVQVDALGVVDRDRVDRALDGP